MNTTPQTMLLKACDPSIAVANSGVCKPCSSQADLLASTAAVCNSWGGVRFFTYTVTRTFGVGDTKNFHATLTLENFSINTNSAAGLQAWLESNIVITPNLSTFSPTITFQPVAANTIPAGNRLVLPFVITLVVDLDVDTTVSITFASNIISSTYPNYLNMVVMTTPPTLLLSTITTPVFNLD